MNNLKNDVYFIKKALKEIGIIEEYSKNKTCDDYHKNFSNNGTSKDSKY